MKYLWMIIIIIILMQHIYIKVVPTSSVFLPLVRKMQRFNKKKASNKTWKMKKIYNVNDYVIMFIIIS